MNFTWGDKFCSKINKFWDGFVANTPICLTYGLCCTLTIICIDQTEKIRFISAAKNELHQNAISQELFDSIKAIINGASIFDTVLTIVVIFLCFFISQFLLRRAAGLNWSQAVTLHTAIEFSSAMRKMGLLDFSDQMACVYKHHLRVYIAKTPLLVDQGEDVCAKLYRHVHNDILFLEDMLTKSIGKRLLCLDADEYNSIYQQYSQTEKATILAKIAERDMDIAALKGTLSLKEDDLAKLREEKDGLKQQLTKATKVIKTAPARDGKAKTADLRNIPLWQVLIPLGARLKAEAKADTEYTRNQIQKEFFLELDSVVNRF